MATTTQKRKVISAVTAVVVSAAILLTGTFAWQSISQVALNEKTGAVNPGARLHDDFDGTNKDIYVENFTDPNNGGVPIYARIRLDEYMEIGLGAGLKTGDADYDSKEAVSLIAGADINDVTTWKTHIPDDATDTFHDDYWSWTLGGQTTYMPTFNKNKDSLKADINGTYDGTDATDDIHYDDYHAYSLGEQKTADAVYDADDNSVDEGDNAVNPDNITTKEETHTAASTLDGTVITMAEWKAAGSKPGAYWVYDVDGWAYWAQAIEPGTATGLLLDGISLQKEPGDNWYYGINVVGQFATMGDWGTAEGSDGFFGENDGPAPTADALFLLNQAAGRELTVKVTAPASEVKLGNTLQLTAAVSAGEAVHPNQKVNWSVSGGTSVSTRITSDGVLTVGADELVGGTLTVRALSTVDNTTFATYSVTVLSSWDTTGLGSMTPGTLETVTIDGRDWYLLARDGNKALIWAKEMEPTFGTNGKGTFSSTLGDTEDIDNVWDTSDTRTWLNESYLTSTLSTLQNYVVETNITTRSEYNAETWITTQDKVFLLSEADLSGTFGVTATSEAKDYTYGTSQLVTDVNMRKCDTTIDPEYWLRSPRGSQYSVAYCYASTGDISNVGAARSWHGVRPALWVNLAG